MGKTAYLLAVALRTVAARTVSAVPPPDDHTFPPRRSLLLRSLLRNRAPRLFEDERLNIDPGILRAFLDVPAYLHGARSLESIIEMSARTGSLRYERSALPARHQLGLHVDPDAFLGLVRA